MSSPHHATLAKGHAARSPPNGGSSRGTKFMVGSFHKHLRVACDYIHAIRKSSGRATTKPETRLLVASSYAVETTSWACLMKR